MTDLLIFHRPMKGNTCIRSTMDGKEMRMIELSQTGEILRPQMRQLLFNERVSREL